MAKQSGLSLLLAGGAVLGGALLVRRKKNASSSTRASSSTSSSSDGPAWTPGPGNEGRVYGQLNDADLPGYFYGSNVLLIDPGCQWVAEGDRFLPVGEAMEHPTAHLSQLPDIRDSATTGWGYVKKLVDVDKLDAASAAQQLFQDAANYYVTLMREIGLTVPTPACLAGTHSPPVAAWLADTTARIQAWIDARPNLPTAGFQPAPTATFEPIAVDLGDTGGLR